MAMRCDASTLSRALSAGKRNSWEGESNMEDSIERIREDAEKHYSDYWACDGAGATNAGRTSCTKTA